MRSILSQAQRPVVVGGVWLIIVIVTFLTKGAFNPAKCNNFMIFRGVWEHFAVGTSLYGLYPAEYADCNHYGPLFALIVAPFSILPRVPALLLWQLFLAGSLFWAIWEMPATRKVKACISWVILLEVLSALQMQQFNMITAALILSTYTALRRERRGWAAFFVAVGALVKLYGIVGMVFFLFFPRKWRSAGWLLFWIVVLILAPAMVCSPEYLAGQYAEWWHSLIDKNVANGMEANNLQNISAIGMIHRLSGADFSDLWILLPAMLLYAAPLLRRSGWECHRYQWGVVASSLMCVILFSTGSESSGYVIAMTGIGLWFFLEERRPWSKMAIVLLWGAFLICGFGGSDLLPRAISRGIVRAYALKALPVLLIWLRLSLSLSFRGLEESASQPQTS